MTADKKPLPSQLEFFDIPSPCIGVCQSGPRGYCVGCFRSRDERLYWQRVNNDTKRQIIAACVRRKQAALRKRRDAAQSEDKPAAQQTELFPSDEEVSQKG
ncbi:DUF1289 domain-containing protein [Alteromonas aestuariivivens]|uniref:DUF1289 domain-containing protein n=1 Tax=Alteromonas aestuariivivens TaxID=1938339 RepID=A0A3D8MEV5_9ALTE|nr:DUF1289 domain-containing protein [Alteromonas aestuariivivens]RDV29091.1 DUF1289 domain-containing protein [Alteromonas aestuariivivens]